MWDSSRGMKPGSTENQIVGGFVGQVEDIGSQSYRDRKPLEDHELMDGMT